MQRENKNVTALKAITLHSSVICFGPSFAIWNSRSQRGSARSSGNSRYQFPAPARSCGGTERPPAAQDAGALAPENIPFTQRLPQVPPVQISDFESVSSSCRQQLPTSGGSRACAGAARDPNPRSVPHAGACWTPESRVSGISQFEQRTGVCKHPGFFQAQILSVWGPKPVTTTLLVTAKSTRLAFPSGLANPATDSTSRIC